MIGIRDFILTVIAAMVIGYCSHIWYLENIHTDGSGETFPPVNVTNSSESFISNTMRVTGFCLCSKCCGRWASIYPRRTASGHIIHPGDKFVAASKDVPFGTLLIVPGYNNGRPVPVLDRGGAIKGNRLDLYFSTHQEALNFGVKNVVVQKEN